MKKMIFLLLFPMLMSCQVKTEDLKNQQILNLDWQFREAGTNKWNPAEVPGCVHADLLRNGKIVDPFYRNNEKVLQWIDKKDWEYKTTFELSKEVVNNAVVQLKFDGLDTYADVYINGHKVLSADNMFRTWVADIKEHVKAGENELKVYFHSPITVGLQKLEKNGFTIPALLDFAEIGGLEKDQILRPFSRKAQYHYGWDWGPRFVTSGIWRPVSLGSYNTSKISDVYYHQAEVNDKVAKINTYVEIDGLAEEDLTLIIKDRISEKLFVSKIVSIKKGANTFEIPFEIKNPNLWWTNGLGEQHLYDMEASLVKGDITVSSKSDKIGIRSIKVIEKSDADGKGTCLYFELNGVPVFMKGANHIPNDMFADRFTKDVYNHEIQSAADANMNMIRVWGGGIYENDYFYQLCDEKGLLVWQDFMFACGMYPGDEAFLENVKQEAIDNVKRLRNRPCIALWCGNNEIDMQWDNSNPNGYKYGMAKAPEEQKEILWKNYEKIFKSILPDVVAKYDIGKDYRHSSPMVPTPGQHATKGRFTNEGDVHDWSVWHQRKPFENYAKTVGRFMSEYGFQSFPEMESIEKYAFPEDHDINSTVMKSHQRSGIGNEVIKQYMEMYYNVPEKFEDFIYLGQVMQAEGLKIGIEAHRNVMPYNMGSLYWQINDCWPVASWASIDYYRNWKAMHYFVKKAFEPIIVTAQVVEDSTIIRVVSDKLETIENAKLTLKVIDFGGKEYYNKSQDISIPTNTASILLKAKDSEFDVAPNGQSILKMEIEKDGEVIANNTLFYSKMKDVELPKPQIAFEVKEQGDDFLISIKSDKLVKNLWLNIDGVEGFFSDNYMNVLPGETIEILFTPKQNISIEELESYLAFKHLGAIE